MTRPMDFETRLRIQTEFDRVLLVEAGAGTGKTSVLTARILYWLLGPGWDRAQRRLDGSSTWNEQDVATDVMSRVLALTFTEAAAAEMRLRILEGLRTVASRQPPGPALLVSADFLEERWDEYAARAEALVAASHRLVATTIHAFCNRLLLAHPLEAGLHPLPRVDAEEEEIGELVARLVAEEFVPLYESEQAAVRETVLGLAAVGIRPSAVTELLSLVASRAVPADALARRADEPKGVDLDWFRRNMQPLAESLGDIAREAAGPVRKNARKVREALLAIETLPARLAGSATGLDALVFFHEFWSVEKVKAWSANRYDTEIEKSIFEKFPEMASQLADLSGLWNRAVLGPLKEVVFPIARHLEEELSSRGLLSYDALLRRASDLLRSRPDLALSLRKAMDLLVIDEFQDTDQVQCEIVTALALEGGQRPSLMLVGDPKQSIYGFRSADLEAYDDFVSRVIEQGGERLVLHANFRSHGAILTEVERLVAPSMLPVRGIQPGFQRLEAAAQADPPPGKKRRPVEHWVFPVLSGNKAGGGKVKRSKDGRAVPGQEKSGARAQAQVEAEAIAADVSALHAEGVPWRDMALLLRSTTHLDTFIHALDRHEVPYVTSSSKGYYQREDVVLAVSLVQAILDWDDQLSLAGVLRSALSGLPDAAFAPLWNSGGLASRLVELARLRVEMEEPVPGGEDRDSGTADHHLRRRERVAWEEIVSLLDTCAGNLAGLPGMDRIQGWEKSVLQFLDALTRLRVSYRVRATDRFLEDLRNLSAIEVMEAWFVDGPRRLANLQALFDDLRDAMEDVADPRAVLRTLRGWLEDSGQGEVDRPDTVADALSVLTIHGSKGLGFGHLYLAQLGAPAFRRNRSRYRVEFLPSGDSWEFLVRGFETEGWAEAEARRQEKERAEILRLFYVAATRAKSRLVFVGHWPPSAGRPGDRDGKEDGQKLHSYVSLLGSRPISEGLGRAEDKTLGAWVWSHLSESQGHLEGGSGDEGTAVLVDRTLEDDDQVRCVVFSPSVNSPSGLAGKWPGDARPSLTPSEGRDHSDMEGFIAQLADRTRALAKKRDSAIQRMQRPLSSGPSRLSGEADRSASFLSEEQDGSFGMEGQDWRTVGSILESVDGLEAPERRLAGLLVHRALESWDAVRDPALELERACRGLRRRAALLAGRSSRPGLAADLACRLLGTFAGPGGLVERLRRVGPTILGRELPILFSSDQNVHARLGDLVGGPSWPVSHWRGRVDLLYEDLDAGCLVVADYKTEPVSGVSDRELLKAARLFEPQLLLYAGAVSLALNRPLRAEIWFIEASRVVELFRWEEDGPA